MENHWTCCRRSGCCLRQVCDFDAATCHSVLYNNIIKDSILSHQSTIQKYFMPVAHFCLHTPCPALLCSFLQLNLLIHVFYTSALQIVKQLSFETPSTVIQSCKVENICVFILFSAIGLCCIRVSNLRLLTLHSTLDHVRRSIRYRSSS